MSLAAERTPLSAALAQLGPHEHLCSIYESPQEHYAVAVPFIRIGLDRGEKCIYIADDGTVGDVRQAMQSEGIDVERATASKALVLATKEQAYLKHGSFHPDWMFTFWKKATQLAMSEGFSALRATGETEWVLRGGRGLARGAGGTGACNPSHDHRRTGGRNRSRNQSAARGRHNQRQCLSALACGHNSKPR